MQMSDWLEDLAEFSAVDVAAACKEWRQHQTRRPTPAEIRKLTIESKRMRQEPPKRPQIEGPKVDTEAWCAEDRRQRYEGYRRAEEAREADARRLGYGSWAEMSNDPHGASAWLQRARMAKARSEPLEPREPAKEILPP